MLVLRDLLDYLDAEPAAHHQVWREWTIAPVSGGANNLLYRATSAEADLAVKFTMRDDRDRAGREYAALSALRQAGLQLAPQAIWLDQQRYHQPVVVQTWLDGEVLAAPPQMDADWMALLQHYCVIHSLTPARTATALAEAVLNVPSGAAGKALVWQHAERLPPSARPQSLQVLLTRFEAWNPPTWPAPPRTLCRVDPNWRNFLRRAGGWASVDWENSGWGDPAFELADLMTHPGYEEVAPARWDWLIDTYAERIGDRTAALRARTYATIMLVWWVVRLARYLYEVPRGLDPRLVQRPPDWRGEIERKYARYAARADAHFAALR
ncbi:MAG: aminoglycoside phosphotransferase family protein [Roseiflexaceae bacterium]